MKNFLPKLGLAFLLILLPRTGNAQLLIQDFDLLLTVQDFVGGTNPSEYQVSHLGSEPMNGPSNTVYFDLPTEAGDQAFRLNKANSQHNTHKAFFTKNFSSTGVELLKLQFDLAVSAGAGTRDALGSFYIGHNLGNTGFYPEHKNRFATIDLNFEGGNAFSINHAVLGNIKERSGTVNGEARISIFMNNGASPFTYLSPEGTAKTLGSKKLDVWIDERLAINEAAAHAAAGVELSAIKFSSRNNQAEGTATFDNFLIERVQPFSNRPVLSQAGGTFTVGSGGQFGSLSNPGGVFEALNALQGPVNAPFVFHFVSDLVGETGRVRLQEIAGTAAGRTISFLPQQQNRSYTISGDNKLEEGGMLVLEGADWVVIDGRAPGNLSEGLNVGRQLVFRNAGTAPTFVLQQDASHNTLAYSTIQGVSTAGQEGIITFGSTAAQGNDNNAIRYNRIGSYGNHQALHSITAYHAGNGASEGVLIEGNQFQGFAALPTETQTLEPGVLKVSAGNRAWTIRGNHFYQAGGQAIVTNPGPFRFVGIGIDAGAGHLVQANYLGGTAVHASGGKARVEALGGQAAYPSVIPFLVSGAGSSAEFTENTIREIEVTGRPTTCDAMAFGALIEAGTADFTNNTFGSEKDKSIVVRARTGAGSTTGGYLTAPVYYRQQASGKVIGNVIGGFSLEVIPAGANSPSLVFTGILSNSGAQLSEISQNTILNVRSVSSGQATVSITGILSAGTGATSILRNVLFDFYNDATTTAASCTGIDPVTGPSINGIVVDHRAGASGEVLVANNMITLYSPADLNQSLARFNGILLPASMEQTVHIYYNSVFVHGEDNAATGDNFLLYRTGTAPARVKNNLLLNTRSTNNPNFILGSLYGDWESDYNLLYQASGAATKDFGLFATHGNPGNAQLADHCAGWQGISGQDQHSVCENAAPYLIDPEKGNLRMVLSLDNNPVIDQGTPVAQINTDIDEVVRVVPDIGASEGYNAWIGAESTAWFENSNWSAGMVPNCERYSQVVVLPQGSVVPGQGASSRVVHQPVIVAAASPAVYRNLLVLEGATLTIGDVNALLQQCSIDDPLLEGIYNQGTIRYAAAGEISLQGILQQEGTFEPGRGLFTLNGAEEQTIGGNSQLSFWQLAISGGGKKVLGQETWVKGSLVLSSGILQSAAEHLLWMDTEAIITGTPGAKAYVAGPVAKRFAFPGQEFVFPLGAEGVFGPLALIISGEAGQSLPGSFLAEYYLRGSNDPTDLPPATQMAEGVAYVSDYEAWRLNRLEGNARARVGLYYHELTGIANPEEAEVVRWTPAGTSQDEEAEGWALTGEQELQEATAWNLEGPRVLSPPLDFFTFFTLGTQQPQESLPVNLLSFTAQSSAPHVRLNWVTAQEENSSHFRVQRSLDGLSYENIAKVEAAGNSQDLRHYQYLDEDVGLNLAGPIYYRLEQEDIDGTLDWSAPVLVDLGSPDFSLEEIYPNPFSDQLEIRLSGAKNQLMHLRLLDMQGRTLVSRVSELAQTDTKITLKGLQDVPAGLYLLEVHSAGSMHHFKVVKK